MDMDTYLSLSEAARTCNYSQEYLSLRARQGKLRAIKIGRNWFTTKKWLEQYINNVNEYILHNFSTLYQENKTKPEPRISWWDKVLNRV